MFHVGGHQGARGRSGALSRNYPNFLGHTDWKAPLKCGMFFCTFSCVLFVIGVIFTWLGIHDIFGESVPITGPILLSVGTLLLLLAGRQFYLAHNRKKVQKTQEGNEPVSTAVVDNDDGLGPATVVMDDVKEKPYDEIVKEQDEEFGKTPLMDVKLPSSPPLEPGSYIWPPAPAQNPYTSMAMMLYKDPAMMYGPFLAKQGQAVAYTPAALATGSAAYAATTSIPDNDAVAASSSHVVQPVLVAAPPGVEASAPLLQCVHRQASLDVKAQPTQAAAISDGDKVKTPIHNTTLFPDKMAADGLPAVVAKAGISNFPNSTAFMMLTTIELQETI